MIINIKPNFISKTPKKIENIIPKSIKNLNNDLGNNLSEIELFNQIMNFVDREFSKVEQISSKYSISENQVMKRINKSGNYMIKKFENKSMLIFFYQNCSYFINCFIVSN